MGFLESPQNTQKSQKRSAAFKRLNAEFFLKEKALRTAVQRQFASVSSVFSVVSKLTFMGKRAY